MTKLPVKPHDLSHEELWHWCASWAGLMEAEKQNAQLRDEIARLQMTRSRFHHPKPVRILLNRLPAIKSETEGQTQVHRVHC